MEPVEAPKVVKNDDAVGRFDELKKRVALLESIVYKLMEHQHGASGAIFIPLERA